MKCRCGNSRPVLLLASLAAVIGLSDHAVLLRPNGEAYNMTSHDMDLLQLTSAETRIGNEGTSRFIPRGTSGSNKSVVMT